MMSERQYKVAILGVMQQIKLSPEASLPSHGGKAQGSPCQATEKIFKARPSRLLI